MKFLVVSSGPVLVWVAVAVSLGFFGIVALSLCAIRERGPSDSQIRPGASRIDQFTAVSAPVSQAEKAGTH